MTLIFRTALALALSSSLAMGQLLNVTAQDRYITASADVTGGTSESNTDTAPDFGPFVSNVGANASGPDGGAMSGAAQDSQILADSFVLSGTQSASAFNDGSAGSVSLASIAFDVQAKVNFEVTANYTSYDGGFFTYELRNTAGQYFGNWIGIAEGPHSITHNGQLDPGSYTIVFDVSGGSEFSFAEFDGVFELSPLSGNYCVAAANSVGPGATLAVGGSQNIVDNDFRIEASGVAPNVFGLIFYGPNQIQAPFGDGFRCVGGQTYRVQPPVQADANGNLSKSISFTIGPASSGNGLIQPQSTWNFQLWYRDPLGPGGTGSNTSDAIWVTFCP